MISRDLPPVAIRKLKARSNTVDARKAAPVGVYHREGSDVIGVEPSPRNPPTVRIVAEVITGAGTKENFLWSESR